MAKNAPTVQSENAPKRIKMAKNDQKLAKMAKKWEKLDKKSIFSTTTSLGHPVGHKVLEKRVPHPYGARSETIRRVYLGCTVPLVPKYTLRDRKSVV